MGHRFRIGSILGLLAIYVAVFMEQETLLEMVSFLL